MTLWRTIVLWVSTLAADPVVVAEEDQRCQAAVVAAYASMARDESPAPSPPAPPPPKPCPCKGTKVIKPDGAIPQPCFCGDNCKCKPGGK